MSRRTSRKSASRKGAVRPRALGFKARPGHLAPASGLISIPKLQHSQSGEKIVFGSSSLIAFARSLVHVDLANYSDWKRANRTQSGFVDGGLRRFLAEQGQALIAEHFDLSLTLGE